MTVAFGLALPSQALAQSTTRANVWTNGMQANHESDTAGLSEDAALVVFSTKASNWLPDHVPSGPWNLFVHDRGTGVTERVSSSATGGPANGDSVVYSFHAISSDHRFVVFTSWATDLISVPPTATPQIYLRDRVSNATVCVSTNALGAPGNGYSRACGISADGARVVFDSVASDLVAGDTNQAQDVFVKHVTTGQVVRVSVSSTGSQASWGSERPDISRDGRFVVFESVAPDLVAGDTNGERDIFRHDLVTGTTERLNLSTAGIQADLSSYGPAVSGDGNRVVFATFASNLVPNDTNGVTDVLLRDVLAGTTVIVSRNSLGIQANGASQNPVISSDGRYVAFQTQATNFHAPDVNGALADAVRHDTQTGLVELLGASSAGLQAAQGSYVAALSADGAVAVLKSFSNDLIAGDANSSTDVFVRDLAVSSPPITSYCTAKTSSIGCVGQMSSSGVASVATTSSFRLLACNLPPKLNGVFVWGREPFGASFQGGTLCVKPPLVRTAVSNTKQLQTASFPMTLCHGATTFDFTHAEMAQHGVQAGETLYAQFWYRDPGYSPPDNASLTNALSFFVLP